MFDKYFQVNWVMNKGWMSPGAIFAALDEMKDQPDDKEFADYLREQGYLDSDQAEQLRSATASNIAEDAETAKSARQRRKTTKRRKRPKKTVTESGTELLVTDSGTEFRFKQNAFSLERYQETKSAPTLDVPPNLGPETEQKPVPQAPSAADTPPVDLAEADTLIVSVDPNTLNHLQQARDLLAISPDAETVKNLPKPIVSEPPGEKVLWDPQAIEQDALPIKEFGDYRILSKVSEGANGVVYRAQHLEHKHIVALKLILIEEPDDEDQARFEREAKVLSQLDHPHIPKVLDFGFQGETRFIAMDLIEGHDLGALVKKSFQKDRRPPDGRWIARTLSDIAGALAYCHEKGVLHRDVKPSNILIEKDTGRPMLIDFGLAAKDPNQDKSLVEGLSKDLSADGSVNGTPYFICPERISEEPVFGPLGPAADVWSIGATLFYCLSGELPFVGVSVMDVFTAIATSKPRVLHDLCPELSENLERLVSDCLEKAVKRRPTMAEVTERLLEEGFTQAHTRAKTMRNSVVEPEAGERSLLWEIVILLIVGVIAGVIIANLNT